MTGLDVPLVVVTVTGTVAGDVPRLGTVAVQLSVLVQFVEAVVPPKLMTIFPLEL